MITATQAPEKYLEIFDQFNDRAALQPRWLQGLRQDAFARFSETGFPNTHDEDWRFTNVAAVASTPFELAGPDTVSREQLALFGASQFACCLVFVNGLFSQELSIVPALPKGVTVGSLAAQLKNNSTGLEHHLGRYLNTQRDAFAALNTAFIEDGVYVHIPRGVLVETPIYVLYVTAPSFTPTMNHPRNLIVAEESSQVTVVEDYVSLGEGVTFSNAATELVAGDNAHVSHYMIVREGDQAYNFSTLRIQQGRHANVATHSLLLSGALVRNNVHPVLAGEGSECLINGLFMANGRQHMDNYMLVEHASPHCDSRQFYNGILNGQSHGVFHGRIIVHKDAQKTDAKQTNRNLLLSDDAQIDTKPQLEIYADDVKCTHGATIGQFDDNALFYLRSRGLDEAAARHVLLLAFANECLDRMNSPQLRDHLEKLVVAGMPGAATSAGPRRGAELGGNRMSTVAKFPEKIYSASTYDVQKIRRDFPILHQSVHGKPLVYLDNAATTQKPLAVIEAIENYYQRDNSNIHRGVHTLSERATEGYEKVRVAAQKFLNAAHHKEIIFVRGTTEAINLVAQTYGRKNVGSGDEVLITAMEHHSNIVPWQMLCEDKGAKLRVAPINDRGELVLEEFEKLLGPKTKIVAVGHLSNALGTINPVREIVRMAHARNIPVLVDGAQAVARMQVDVQALDCDFYALSSHKLYGPTGVGVLYGKAKLLEAMPPYQGGGDMIASVTFEKTVYNRIPYKFEAGTPNIADTIGLGAALEYLNDLGLDQIEQHEADLLDYATKSVEAIPGVQLVGTAKEKAGVLSFVMEDIHPHDIGTILDSEGIAVRTGHHCAQPVMQRFGIPATARASFGLYNTREEVDALVKGIRKVQEVLG